MIDTGRWAAFLTLSFLVIVVPGPSVLFVIGRGVALGRRAALVTVAANAAGVYVIVLLVAAGLGPFLERSAVLLLVVKLLGAGYLIWLGISAIRHRRDLVDAAGRAVEPTSTRTIAREGFIVGVLNPKAALFFTAVLPQFVVAGGAPVPIQMAVLGAVFVGIALISDSMWGLLAGSSRDLLTGRPRRLEAVGVLGGSLMIGLGLRLALTARA
jgi:threonine/homoserine/homoserine lactone efflux protein